VLSVEWLMFNKKQHTTGVGRDMKDNVECCPALGGVNDIQHSTLNTKHWAKSPCEPKRIQVVVKDGRPCAVIFKKRRLSVTQIVNMWRIDEEWWRKAISRIYYHLELQNHLRLTVFYDLGSGVWYRQNGA
jgi:hypothetical protein